MHANVMKLKFDKHVMPTNANSRDTSTHNQGAALSQSRSEDNFQLLIWAILDGIEFTP